MPDYIGGGIRFSRFAFMVYRAQNGKADTKDIG
jgi:hypothetical protein